MQLAGASVLKETSDCARSAQSPQLMRGPLGRLVSPFGGMAMNREWVLHHLSEARDAIDSTISQMQGSPDYDYGEFWAEMQHLYHHLNTAWNSRDATPDQVQDATDTDFNRWSRFPADLPIMEV
jgi:hypothetical protein